MAFNYQEMAKAELSRHGITPNGLAESHSNQLKRLALEYDMGEVSFQSPVASQLAENAPGDNAGRMKAFSEALVEEATFSFPPKAEYFGVDVGGKMTDSIRNYLTQNEVKDPDVVLAIPKEHMDKSVYFTAVQVNPDFIYHVPIEFQHYSMQKVAAERNPDLIKLFEYRGGSQLGHDDFLHLIENHGAKLSHIPDNAKNEEIFMAAVRQDSYELRHVPEDLLSKELCMAAVQRNGWALQYVPEDLRSKELCMAAVRQKGLTLREVPEELKKEEICMTAVQKDGRALQYVPEDLRSKELCMEAVHRDGFALGDVPKDLLGKELYMAAVQQNGFVLELFPKKLKKEEICMAAVQQNGNALQEVPKDLRSKELCMAAVQKDGRALQYVPERVINEDLCMAAVQQYGMALRYVPERVINEDLCMAAVQQNGLVMRLVPEDLRSEELCMTAVQQNGEALEYVPEELQSEELCMTAVQQNGMALEYVPEDLRSEELCMTAVQQNGEALEYAPKEMRSEIVASMNANHSQQSEQTQAAEQAKQAEAPEQQQAEVKVVDAPADTGTADTTAEVQVQVKAEQKQPEAEAPQADQQVAEQAQTEKAQPEPQAKKTEAPDRQDEQPKASQSEVGNGYDPYQRIRDMEAKGQIASFGVDATKQQSQQSLQAQQGEQQSNVTPEQKAGMAAALAERAAVEAGKGSQVGQAQDQQVSDLTHHGEEMNNYEEQKSPRNIQDIKEGLVVDLLKNHQPELKRLMLEVDMGESAVTMNEPPNDDWDLRQKQYAGAWVDAAFQRFREVVLPVELQELVDINGVRKSVEGLRHIPANQQSEAVRLAAVLENPGAISYIPADQQSEEVRLAAVQQAGMALRYIQTDQQSEEVRLAAVKKNWEALQYIPIEQQSEAVQVAAVQQSDLALERHISLDQVSEGVYMIFMQRDGLMLADIPTDKQTEALRLAAVQQNGRSLEFIPVDEQSEAVRLAAVQQDGWALQFIPAEQQSESMRLSAIQQDGWALHHIPVDQQSEAMRLSAVQQNGLALQFIKADEQSEAVRLAAVQQNSMALRFIPEDLQTKELHMAATKHGIQALTDLPDSAGQDVIDEVHKQESLIQQNIEALGGFVATPEPETKPNLEVSSSVDSYDGAINISFREANSRGRYTSILIKDALSQGALDHIEDPIIKAVLADEIALKGDVISRINCVREAEKIRQNDFGDKSLFGDARLEILKGEGQVATAILQVEDEAGDVTKTSVALDPETLKPLPGALEATALPDAQKQSLERAINLTVIGYNMIPEPPVEKIQEPQVVVDPNKGKNIDLVDHTGKTIGVAGLEDMTLAASHVEVMQIGERAVIEIDIKDVSNRPDSPRQALGILRVENPLADGALDKITSPEIKAIAQAEIASSEPKILRAEAAIKLESVLKNELGIESPRQGGIDITPGARSEECFAEITRKNGVGADINSRVALDPETLKPVPGALDNAGMTDSEKAGVGKAIELATQALELKPALTLSLVQDKAKELGDLRYSKATIEKTDSGYELKLDWKGAAADQKAVTSQSFKDLESLNAGLDSAITSDRKKLPEIKVDKKIARLPRIKPTALAEKSPEDLKKARIEDEGHRIVREVIASLRKKPAL